MNYRKLNVYTGWFIFLIATIVYFLTIEDTVSLWDCGEYITAAFKLEVGHPPGAPLFMVLGRIFSLFAGELKDVAVWINRLSALSSSLTILFMFWSITIIVKKMVLQTKQELSSGDKIAILGSGIVGSLAYTFSDTFWFSAVEGEVYAMASLFTAAIFWAILKWDEEMALVQNNQLSLEVSPNRWLLLIMFLIGLAIGVHLLGILLVPAIGFMIYFRYWEKVEPLKFIFTGLISVIALGFIQEGIIPGTISMASSFEISFVNSLGLPFFTGTIFFFVLLIGGLIFWMRYARKKGHSIVYNSLMGLVLLLIGYGSFAVIVIRSNANTPLDENNPENLVTLISYLKRDQYGAAPLLSGPYWNSKESGGAFNGERWNPYADPSNFKDRRAAHERRFVVSKGGNVLKSFITEKNAAAFAKENNAEYEESYFEINADSRKNAEPTYAQTTFFPRMYNGDEPQKVDGYKKWSGYDPFQEGEKGKDNMALPTMGQNLTYFIRYQCNFMYFRYFMWNFAGRQNDIQGHGDAMRGNWKSGFSAVDDLRLGNQENAPYYTTNNPANNSFYFFPLILGLIGLFFHAYKAPKDAFIVFLGFLFTGLAIVIYLNQKTLEPRERDYAYAGSFYFFAMWIGVAVYALYYAFTSFTKKHLIRFGFIFGGGLLIMLALDASARIGMPNTISWLIISAIAAILIGLMFLLRKIVQSQAIGAGIATVLGLIAPIIMGAEGWDDHDRSNKSTAHDVAYNYMVSCAPNSIIFTNGDNDTFPLWYIQEVEEYRTDVRVCNLSLMQTDWYTEQMMMRAYESDPLPIKFSEDQIMMYTGGTDQIQFLGLQFMYLNPNVPNKVKKKVIDMHVSGQQEKVLTALANFGGYMNSFVSTIPATNVSVTNRLNQLKTIFSSIPENEATISDNVDAKFKGVIEIYNAVQNRSIPADEAMIEGLQTALDTLSAGWNSVDLKDAMEFVRDDANMLSNQGHSYRFFPSSTFRLKVNKENAIKSGIVPKDTKHADLLDEIVFTIEANAITREQIMMMDILANNDWKRGIYFSSPYGSEVSKAIYQVNGVKQNGSGFELNPLKEPVPMDVEEMYKNLMEVYHYGDMANPGVLTDYYARRHTVQFRSQFISLCKYYLQQIDNVERTKGLPGDYVARIREAGNAAEADRIENLQKNGDQIIKDSKAKISALLRKSLAVMPANIVLDGGEPSPAGRFVADGAQYIRYADGMLADYVQMLYDADDNETAEKLGLEMAKQYQQTIEFFMTSDPYFILSGDEQTDLYAALDNYMELYVASNDMSGNPSGKLANLTANYLDKLFKVRFPQLYRDLEEYTRDSNRDNLPMELTLLKNYLNAIGAEQGLVPGSTPKDTQGLPPSGMDIQQMIESQNKQDSIEK